MNVKIDWISFTLQTAKRPGYSIDELLVSVRQALWDLDAPEIRSLFDGMEFSVEAGRKPYPFRWQRADGGLSVFFGQRNDTILFEIGGKGCDWLVDRGLMTPLLRLVHQRLTRIDIAADIRGDTRPIDFATSRKNARIKTTSEFNSPTGQTYYVGSRDSEVYARVYRYNKPHPRHGLLRVEHVLKRKDARTAAAHLLIHGVEHVCALVGNRFGWEHPDWQPENLTSDRLPSVERERGMKSTVYWLHAQVMPAIKRVTADGTLDLVAWVQNYLLPEVYPNHEFDITFKQRDNG